MHFQIVERLVQLDRYAGHMPYHGQQLRICSRTGDIVEPLPKRQWFLQCSEMNNIALEALAKGEVSVYY